MNIQEYSSREILAQFGIPVKPFILARTPLEAYEAALRLRFPVVLKAQVLVGGRGKAGGIKLATNPEEVRHYASQILGLEIKGLRVKKIIVSEAVDIRNEYYISITLDRSKKSPIVIFSNFGGVDIEETARTNPCAVMKYPVDPMLGLMPFRAREFAFSVISEPKKAVAVANLLWKMYNAFVGVSANLVEINPLAEDSEGNFWAADAKIIIDDNALDVRPELEKYRDVEEENPNELRAKSGGLSYVKLEGDIGCAVNGAGLAMATADMIKHFGGSPANFLDVGGSSDPKKMKLALQIITGDPDVKVILVNIFGGITRCDDIAIGLKSAIDELKPKQPLVVRLKGTREEEARKILEPCGIKIFEDMEEAIKEAVSKSRETR